MFVNIRLHVFDMDIMEKEEKDLKQEKKRGRPWEEKEEITLMIEVLEREHKLFGEMKGPGIKSVHRKRNDAWQEITDILNSYVSAILIKYKSLFQ